VRQRRIEPAISPLRPSRFGSKKTLNPHEHAGAWFTAPECRDQAQFLGALDTLALRSEVQGVRVDLADERTSSQHRGLANSSGITCVAQANTVRSRSRQLVDLYRAHYASSTSS